MSVLEVELAVKVLNTVSLLGVGLQPWLCALLC